MRVVNNSSLECVALTLVTRVSFILRRRLSFEGNIEQNRSFAGYKLKSCRTGLSDHTTRAADSNLTGKT